MTFVSVPNTGQSLGATRDQIRTNMDETRTQIAVNHYDVNVSQSGKHKFLQMPATTAPTTAADELAEYVKLVSAVPRLFIREPSSGTERQLTGAVIASSTGETMILGGIIVKWGNVTINNSNTNVTYAGLGLSNFISNSFGVVISVNDNSSGNSIGVLSDSTTGFVAKTSSSNVNCFFIAIGN